MSRRAAALLGLALVLTGCAHVETPVVERPSALADLPTITLHGTGSGTNPVLGWDAVADAGEYLVTVVGSDGPIWAWRGDATSVRFGGYAEEPSPGTGALRLGEAAWWSVSAFDDRGVVVAVSDLHAVSPDGSAPEAPAVVAAAPGPAEVEPKPAGFDLEADGVCPLLDDAEAEEFLEGALAGPGAPEVEGGGRTYYCRWERADDDLLELSVAVSPNIDGERWEDLLASMGAPEADAELGRGTAGVGEDSIVYADWGGTMVQVFTGDAIVQVRSGFTGGAEEGQSALAALVLERWKG